MCEWRRRRQRTAKDVCCEGRCDHRVAVAAPQFFVLARIDRDRRWFVATRAALGILQSRESPSSKFFDALKGEFLYGPRE